MRGDLKPKWTLAPPAAPLRAEARGLLDESDRVSVERRLLKAADAFVVSRRRTDGRRLEDDHRRVSLVRRLGQRHVHRHARPALRDRTV